MLMTPAKMLVQDESGKVTGVVAESKDKGVIQINAKNGVIVCTGGYGANDEMLQDLCPGNSNWCVLRDSVTEEATASAWRCGPSRAGSGRLLHDLEPRHHVRRHRVRRLLPGRRHLPARQPAVPPCERERRALHERGPVLPHELRRRREPAGHFSWIVWDGSYWEDIERFDTCGCSRLFPAPSGTAFNADVYDCEPSRRSTSTRSGWSRASRAAR